MKNTNKKRNLILITLAFIGFNCHKALGQNNTDLIQGVVEDTEGRPIGLANVVILDRSDSLYVAGTTTDSLGRFTLKYTNSTNNRLILHVSKLTYKTYISEIEDTNFIIALEDETNILKEIKVIGHRSIYSLNGAVLTAQISDGPLEHIGNVYDVLGQLPFINVVGESVNVFSKGTPLIYINNRQVRSDTELRMLRSERIKSIEINTSPGSEYPSTVGAVIRIYTLNNIADNLAGEVSFDLDKDTDWSNNEGIYLSYTAKSMTIYGDFSNNVERMKQDQFTSMELRSDSDLTVENTESTIHSRSSGYSVSLGFDYNKSPEHFFGAIYRFDNRWKGKSFMKSQSEFLVNSIKNSSYTNDYHSTDDSRYGYLNAYYTGRFGKWKLNVDFDYMYGNSGSNSLNQTLFSNGTTDKVTSKTNDDYDFFATKIYSTKNLVKDIIMFGGQYSFTNKNSEYIGLDYHEDLPSSISQNKQHLLAFFATYGFRMKNLAIDVGLRYEKVEFNYYLNGSLSDVQSKDYNQLFPIFAMSYRIPDKNIAMSMSFRRTTVRPSYYSMRPDIQYNSPHSYESGNPALKNAFVNDLTYIFAYKNLYFMASYKNIKDNIFFLTKQFENKLITLSTFENVRRYELISLVISYNRTFFDVWTPHTEIAYTQPILSHTFNGDNTRYNKPKYAFRFYNTFQLPKNFIIRANFSYNTSSNNGFNDSHHSFITSVSVNKTIKRNWTLTVGVNDIFNQGRERWSQHFENVNLYKKVFSDNRYYYVSLSFRFNTIKQYDRDGADSKERRRLQ